MCLGVIDSSTRKSVVSFFAICLVGILGCGKNPTPTTKATNSKVAENARPLAEERYVGSQVCADCHGDISRQYADHSMGRSAAVLDASFTFPMVDNAKFDADGYRYTVRKQDSEWIHEQVRIGRGDAEVASIDLVAKHVIGSGNHGQSFLVERDDYLFMSPITWYPDKQIWHLSPGYEVNNSQFNRPVVESCLYCHTDVATSIPHTLNKYASPAIAAHAIGCERCHGPGHDHVAKQEEKPTDIGEDASIVNPSRLEFDLREAVCQQCHLSGAARVTKPGKTLRDFQPGESLESAFTVFTASSEKEKFVGHVEQMYASRCFNGGDGGLGCISCHDPHSLPPVGDRVAFYRDRCLSCHTAEACAIPLEARRAVTTDDSCIDCHMPPLETEIRHAAITDHSIPRTTTTKRTVSKSVNPLIAFPSNEKSQNTPRDAAIALVRVGGRRPELFSSDQLDKAQQVLEKVVAANKSDFEASEALAGLYLAGSDAASALRVCSDVLAIQPHREQSLVIAADICSDTQSFGQAIAYWGKAIEVNPWMSKYWYRMGQAYAATGQWFVCRQVATEAKLRFPTSIGVRHLIMQASFELGEPQAADKEYREIEEFNPDGFQSIRDWYQRRAQ